MSIHMSVDMGFLNANFPTYIAAITQVEFPPDRSLEVTKPWFTWEQLPWTVATNKAFSMFDFHMFP